MRDAIKEVLNSPRHDFVVAAAVFLRRISSVRLKVEQIQLVSEGLWVNLGSIRLQGA